MLLDYINIMGQTGKVSREALYLIMNMLKDDIDFLNYLIKESKFFETLVRIKIINSLNSFKTNFQTNLLLHRRRDYR